MPRIRVATPTAADIKAHPRAYALLQQAADRDGAADSAALSAYLKLYGNPERAVSEGEISFEDFAALFAKPGTAEGTNCLGWAAREKGSALSPYSFDRRPVGPKDVRIQITHAGICHSDIHQVEDEWGLAMFPMVPGHEIVGIVTEVGPQVAKFKVGDRAGVGCMVGSCGSCGMCKDKGEEQFCKKIIYTYSSKHPDGTVSQGGYATSIVVTEHFALRIPDNLPLDAAAPLLCAGITTYSPLRYHHLDKPGMRIGVVGLGGLGHMAVKLAKGMGVHVTVISTSKHKEQDAIQGLGADSFLVSTDVEAMQAAADSLDGIIDTVAVKHDLHSLLSLLKVDGKLIMLGVPNEPFDLVTLPVIFKRLTVAGSPIGGIRETQEMLDFCGKHNIVSTIETIPITQVNEAYKRMLKSDVKYRFVIDIQGSLIA